MTGPAARKTAHGALQVRLLGGFAVRVGSRTVADADWRLRRARTLIKLLALAPGHRLHREQAVELLWPEAAPAAAANNLHQALQGTPVAMVALCHVGSEQAAAAAVRPLREAVPPLADLVGPIPYTAFQAIGDAGTPTGIRAYFRALYFDELTHGAIEALLRQCDELRDLHPFTTLHIHHLEGAVGRVAEDATASGRRSARYVLNVVGLWDGAAQDAEQIAWVRRTSEALQPFAGGGSYLNFLTDVGEDRVRAVYGPAKYARLAALKARYDPANLFRLNQNVKPEENGSRP